MSGKKRQPTSISTNEKVLERGKIKTIIFSIVLVLLPVFFLLLVEVVLRLTGYGDNYKLFVEFEHYGKTFKTTNSDYGKKYFSQLNYTTPSNDIFLKNKPENGYRIFVIGSSTVAGFPYNTSNSFSRILQQRLQDSYPDQFVETINVAITAINSYSFYDMINQILREKPDALVIYAGHNEFYGAMGISSIEGLGRNRSLKLAHLKLLNLKTYQLIGNAIGQIKKIIPKPVEGDRISGETLMESIAYHKSIEYNSKIYRAAHNHYQNNMGSILRKATKKNVTVLLSDVVGNIKDLEPFVVVESEIHPPADKVFNNAKELEINGEFSKAKELYYQAKDLDGLRFRASEDINWIIHELTKEHKAILVPMKDVFEENSPNNLIGNNLLTEHVHPNIDGYFLMADAFYNSFIENGIIGKHDSVNIRSNDFYRQNWGFTPLDSVFTDLRLQQLLTRWPFTKTNHQTSFLEQYNPVNQLDSLAMKILMGEISLGDAYRQMAVKHERKFQNYEAYQYILALARMNPHNPNNFVKAGDLLLMENDYILATEMYLLSIRYSRPMNQLYKIGELYLRLDKREMATLYLAEAHQTASGDVKEWIGELLKEIENGINRFTEDMAVISDRDGLIRGSDTQLRGSDTQQRVVIFAPTQVTEKITEARLLMHQQNFQKALELLHEANEIHETPVANRFIGEIMLYFQDSESLSYLRKAYPDHSTNANFIATFCYAAIFFGENEMANEMIQRLKSIDPDNQRISFLEQELMRLL